MPKFDDSAQAWMERIEEALEYRRVYGLEDRWAKVEAMYGNLTNSGADKGPNLIQEMSEALEARLDIANPYISIYPSPFRQDSIETAPIVEAIDNWMMRELDVNDHVGDCILHSYLWGRGIMKMGYDSEWGYDEAFDLKYMKEYGGLSGATMTQFDSKGLRIEYGPGRPGLPWIAPVLPHDFVVPWGTKNLQWTPWVAHRVIRHVDLFKKDVKYTNKRNVKPTMSMRDIVDSYKKPHPMYRTSGNNRNRGASGSVEYIEMWEIRNRLDGKIKMIIDGTKMHRNDTDLLQINGVPFASISLVRAPRTFWFSPQASYLMYHQGEQNDISLTASQQRRANVLRFLYQTGAMEQTELDKALSAEVGIAAAVKAGINPRDAIHMMPQGNNYSLYGDAEFSRRNARVAIGFSPNQLGEFSGGRRSATESLIVDKGATARTDLRQGYVSNFYNDIFKTLNQFVFKFWKTPRVVQVADQSWPRFSGDDIKNDYAYQIQYGGDRPKDAGARRQFALMMYRELRQDPLVDPVGLRNWMSRSFTDAEFSQLFRRGDDANLLLSMPGVQEGMPGAAGGSGAGQGQMPILQ